MIEAEKLDTETLGDRFLHELKYFAETGNHLDEDTATGTITSSRGADDNTMIVNWSESGALLVRRCHPDFLHDRDYWRPRQVVSSPTKSEK